MLNVLPIHKGDFFQIDSGTVHAIKTGTLILETQQSSDVTYRLYDYDRPGTDGKLRPLHIEQSLDCIEFDAQAPTDGTVTAPEVDGVTKLESNPCYTVDRVRVDGSKTLDQRWPFMCLSVIDGEGTICGDPVRKGSHPLAPSTVGPDRPRRQMELIVSTCRSQQQPNNKGLPRSSTEEPLLVSIYQPTRLSRSKSGRAERRSQATLSKDLSGRMGQHRSRVPHAKEST
ncbi:MAG: class I mannose-6-phosphate isomerase, partial [Collinsella sp.]